MKRPTCKHPKIPDYSPEELEAANELNRMINNGDVDAYASLTRLAVATVSDGRFYRETCSQCEGAYMIAFPGMLVEPAKQAGMKVPEDPDNFNPDEYPHWNIYLTVQIGAPLPNWTAHWDNAKVVAALTEEQCKTITYKEILEMGLQVGYPIP